MSEPKQPDANGKMRYDSVEEFVQEQREHILPMLDEIQRRLTLYPNPRMESELRRLLLLFENDCALLRKRAARALKPDGSVEFNFTPDALRLLRERQ